MKMMDEPANIDASRSRRWLAVLIRGLRMVLRIFTWVTAVVVLLLLLFQHRLIYHPRAYTGAEERLKSQVVTLPFTTAQGMGDAFYLGPRTLPLRKVWVLFPGNGSLALDWMGILKTPPNPQDGYLMIDYPGYGDCQGSPSPSAIEENAEAAFAALAASLHETPEEIGDLGALCHSLGCATGLDFAVHHPVDRVILMAPFTSMGDMARRTVGWPLCLLLTHRYDNRARLAELAARAHPPAVAIFHGEDDTVIPVAMGRELAEEQPQMITFHEVPGADHNTVIRDTRGAVIALMR